HHDREQEDLEHRRRFPRTSEPPAAARGRRVGASAAGADGRGLGRPRNAVTAPPAIERFGHWPEQDVFPSTRAPQENAPTVWWHRRVLSRPAAGAPGAISW